MKGSTVSRRVSEFVGVALFAAALIWIIALATYAPDDPVWFFRTGPSAAPSNFAGRVGAFLAELSFQLVGSAAYMIPVLLVLIGWHYFWCRRLHRRPRRARRGGPWLCRRTALFRVLGNHFAPLVLAPAFFPPFLQ